MTSNYGKGLKMPIVHQIFPAEALTGSDNLHDYAVYCAILTAAKIMTIPELKKFADWIQFWDPNINQRVAETCKRIVKENLGYIFSM